MCASFLVFQHGSPILSPIRAPKPEGLPQAQQGALELPGQLAEAQEGYGLELLTPAQYDATLDSGKGGPRQYLTGDVFVLGLGDGLGEEQFAVANPNGKIVTDFVYDGSQDGYWTAYGGWIAMRKDGESVDPLNYLPEQS